MEGEGGIQLTIPDDGDVLNREGEVGEGDGDRRRLFAELLDVVGLVKYDNRPSQIEIKGFAGFGI